MSHNKIVIVNFGGQYVRLIAKKLREAGVYCEIVPPDQDLNYFQSSEVKGIILSGGPDSVNKDDVPKPATNFFSLDRPMLGICYGMQLMAEQLPGGKVSSDENSEYGRADLEILQENNELFSEVFTGDTSVWMSHGDSVKEAPQGFTVMARTAKTPVVAMADTGRNLYGVQFHPEVTHTAGGQKLLENFAFKICEIEEEWNLENLVADKVERIKSLLAADDNIIIGLSGGVDSAVAAALIERAAGDKITGVFIDHGLLRHGEAEQVKNSFKQAFDFPIYCLDASGRFLQALQGVSDPEKKRNIIGEEFISVFEEKAEELDNVTHLAQGTIYSDVIESGLDQNAALIKSHHNVGGLPERMKLKLLEPLRDFFKDEVRKIGEQLGLPPELIWRQPFPGPGLAIRIVGEIDEEKLEILRRADYILQEELADLEIEEEIWQAFAVLPDMRSVGVQGDSRTYGYPIIIRAVSSEEAMTADWVRIPHEILDIIAGRIVDEISEVNRVVYDISSKPPATIEWE